MLSRRPSSSIIHTMESEGEVQMLLYLLTRLMEYGDITLITGNERDTDVPLPNLKVERIDTSGEIDYGYNAIAPIIKTTENNFIVIDKAQEFSGTRWVLKFGMLAEELDKSIIFIHYGDKFNKIRWLSELDLALTIREEAEGVITKSVWSKIC